MYILAMALLAMLGDPGVEALVGLCFLSFFGAQLLDLAQRALIVQRSRYETEVRGWLRVFIYDCSFQREANGN
jgi:hypothetical protein